jgi:hypothetical protein
MPEIKERPILFSAPMVRAILEGRKTVTRREVKKRAALDCLAAGFEPAFLALAGNADLCPYGKPGDRLWVRESWWQAGDWQPTYPEDDTGAWFGGRRVFYAADGTPPNEPNHSYPSGLQNGSYSAAAPNKVWRHRPSIHMNRWASRIQLEITGVRVERLKDVSDEQAKAEGCFFTDYGKQCFHGGTGWKDVGDCPAVAGHQQREGWMWDKTTSHEQCLGSARHAFGNLWNSVNGPDAWDTNPWVWVVEFKRVTS